MHLRNRRCGQRCAVELRKHLLQRTRQCTGHQRLRLFTGERRHGILQLGQFGGDIGRQQVRTCGNRLAELDEHRPQLF